MEVAAEGRLLADKFVRGYGGETIRRQPASTGLQKRRACKPRGCVLAANASASRRRSSPGVLRLVRASLPSPNRQGSLHLARVEQALSRLAHDSKENVAPSPRTSRRITGDAVGIGVGRQATIRRFIPYDASGQENSSESHRSTGQDLPGCVAVPRAPTPHRAQCRCCAPLEHIEPVPPVERVESVWSRLLQARRRCDRRSRILTIDLPQAVPILAIGSRLTRVGLRRLFATFSE